MSDADPNRPKYRRVLLKLSGEAFGHGGQERHQHRRDARHRPADPKTHPGTGVQLAIVVGGGNILRGAQFTAGGEVIKEATAHYMGMLATVINGLALQDALESLGVRDPAA